MSTKRVDQNGSQVKSLKFTRAKILETIKRCSGNKYKHIQVSVGKREFDGRLLYTDFSREVDVDRYYIEGDYVFFSLDQVATCRNYIDGMEQGGYNGIGYNSSFVGMSFHAYSSKEGMIVGTTESGNPIWQTYNEWHNEWHPWYKLKILAIVKDKKNNIVGIRTKKCMLLINYSKSE